MTGITRLDKAISAAEVFFLFHPVEFVAHRWLSLQLFIPKGSGVVVQDGQFRLSHSSLRADLSLARTLLFKMPPDIMPTSPWPPSCVFSFLLVHFSHF